MTVGIAFSGGDMVAMAGSMCSTAWIARNFNDALAQGSDVVISSVSGGTLGYGLMTNAELYVPPYEPTITLEAASNHMSEDGMEWFGTAAVVLAKHKKDRRRADDDFQFQGIGELGWKTFVETMYRIYGIHPNDIQSGNLEWYDNFAAISKSYAPLKANDLGILDAPVGVGMAWREMRSQTVFPQLGAQVSAMDAIAFSSAFWAMDPIFDRSLKFALENLLLPQNKDFYFSDAGTVDITGITTLLARGTDSVLAFFNDVGDVKKNIWMIRTLFGSDEGRQNGRTTDVGGAKNTQVFPSDHLEEVVGNLTNPNIMRSILYDVPVLENKWLGIRPYTVKKLIIYSTMYSDEFMDSFHDTRIKDHLRSDFPNGYTFSIPKLDANILCMLNEWKMDQHKDEIADLFNGY